MITCREILENPSLIRSNEVYDIFKPLLFPDINSLANEIIDIDCINISEELSALIKKETMEFHSRFDTLTNRVSEIIESISSNSRLLIIPHQPNYFASLNVLLPIFLLEYLGKRLDDKKYILLYLIIDYDEAGDNRFKRAKYPDALKAENHIYLSDNISSASKHSPMHKIGMPNEKEFIKSLEMLEASLKQNISALKKMKPSLSLITNLMVERWAEMKQDILSIFHKSNSITDFNSGFISYVVNKMFGYNICFFKGSKAVSLYKSEIIDFNLTNKEFRQSINEAIYILEKNNITCSFKKQKDTDSQLWAYCPACKIRHNISIINGELVIDKCNTKGLAISFLNTEIYPKVILDDILDSTFYRKAASTGYIGQAEHLFISSYVSTKIGVKVPPHLIQDSSNFIFGYFEYIQFLNFIKGRISRAKFSNTMKLSSKGKSSILYYLINFGAEKMKLQFESFYFSNAVNNYNNNQFMSLANDQDLLEINKKY